MGSLHSKHNVHVQIHAIRDHVVVGCFTGRSSSSEADYLRSCDAPFVGTCRGHLELVLSDHLKSSLDGFNRWLREHDSARWLVVTMSDQGRAANMLSWDLLRTRTSYGDAPDKYLALAREAAGIVGVDPRSVAFSPDWLGRQSALHVSSEALAWRLGRNAPRGCARGAVPAVVRV